MKRIIVIGLGNFGSILARRLHQLGHDVLAIDTRPDVVDALGPRVTRNLRYHRVVQGDTLGKLAFTFGSTIKAIQEANNLKGTMIRIGQTLAIPLRGPCVNCPMPPEVIVPPRRLPPQPPAPLLASIPELPAPAGEAASPELELFLAPWTAWSQIGAAL